MLIVFLLWDIGTPSKTSRRQHPCQEVIPPRHGQPAGISSLMDKTYLGFQNVFWHKKYFGRINILGHIETRGIWKINIFEILHRNIAVF